VSNSRTRGPAVIAGHTASFDAHGRLMPWTAWRHALDLEMNFYQQCPAERGYPRFVLATFLDGEWNPIPDRTDTIPSTQNGMGIISYLKYYAWTKKQNPKILEFAQRMGDYLVKESLTPDAGKYPRFTRSTGWRAKFPQPADCGSQADRKYEIEPDKGGIHDDARDPPQSAERTERSAAGRGERWFIIRC
jgi:hypothetical protein